MKVSRERAAQNRERIVEVAAQRFRERGFDGIGIVDLMKEAGLTHGAFYGHFSSKEELMAEASALAWARSLERWTDAAEQRPSDPLAAIAAIYLTRRHRDAPGTGCLMAALGSDVSRQGSSVRRTVTKAVRDALEALADRVPGRSSAKRRQKAIGAYATLVGAMVLARAVDDAELSQEIMDASLVLVEQ